jgi:hypothetical protein
LKQNLAKLRGIAPRNEAKVRQRCVLNSTTGEIILNRSQGTAMASKFYLDSRSQKRKEDEDLAQYLDPKNRKNQAKNHFRAVATHRPRHSKMSGKEKSLDGWIRLSPKEQEHIPWFLK